MHYIYKGIVALLALVAMAACDDNTSTLGIYSENDGITNSSSVYDVTTRSLKMDSVVASSTVSYLGNITDPETGADIRADFATQYYCLEDYKFPEKEVMVGEANGDTLTGIVQCDSCEVRLYFNDYYGDGDNPMKLEVYELSADHIMDPDSVYYTDVDLTKFLPENAKPIATRVFTPIDYNQDEASLTSSTYNNNVKISLPASFGQRIMERYYEHPEYFKNSYYFIRNVFPGFYFKVSNGLGTMLSVYVGTINLFYRYNEETEEGTDTTYVGLTRFAATPEVVQSTHFVNNDMEQLISDNKCTYLKTPAGICTEMTLPIDEIFAGAHATDSISKATISLTRYNKNQDDYQLGTPSELLMVRKKDMYSFFLNHQVADSKTSYTTSFNSTYNTYEFSNISRLLSYCKHEKMTAAAAQGITEEAWATQNPDWNKVVLIPVITSSASSSTTSSSSQVSVTHDLNLNSIRLVGGDTKLKMQVIYSQFYQQ